MPQPIPTHINAFYADLLTAKRELAVAEQKVKELEDVIVARGGELPDANGSLPEVKKEDVAHSDDVSAAEDNGSQKGKK